MIKKLNSSIFITLSLLYIACSGSAKVTQGNDASASVYKPNNLSSASAEISASTGGYINVGKAQLRIPAQALEADTTITAEVADITLPEGGAKAIGKGIRLKPEGLQFLKPAELMLCYSSTEAANLNASGAKIYYHTEDNQYVAIAGNADLSTSCVTSHIEHFSSYVAAAYSQLPGNTAPVIGGANFLPTTPLAGIPLRVRTAIDDVNGSTPIGTTVPGTVVTAFFYYRTVGSPTFTKVALQPDTTDDTVTNRYFFQIPGSEVTTGGIEYYFEATDNLNVTRRVPTAAGSFSTRTVPTAATGIRLNPTGSVNISAGFSRAFTLQATDNGTTWQNISADNFSLTNSSLGTALRTGPSTIRFNAVGAGTGQLTSTIGALSAGTTVNVVPGLLTHIELTDTNQVALAGSLELPVSQVYNFDVVGYDSYGNVAQVYPAFTTTGGIGSVVVDVTGAHFTPAATVGSGSLLADLAGLTDTLSISLYVPPQVTATAPFDQTPGIALNASVGVSFSHVMDTSTLTTTTTSACVGSLQVSSDNFATCVAMASATPTFHASNTLAVIQPAANLAGTTTYKIRVTTAARNTGGYPIAQVYTTPTGFTTVVAPAVLVWNVNELYNNGTFSNMCEDTLTGNLYISGSYNSAGNTTWFVRKSDATGAVWTNTAFSLTMPQSDSVPKIACDSAGRLYLMGRTALGFEIFRSVADVPNGINLGDSFASVETWAPGFGYLHDIVISPSNVVYAMGIKNNGSITNTFVRKSDVNGLIWSDLDEFSYSLPDHSFTIVSGAVDATGKLYLAAIARDPSLASQHLLVRKFDGLVWSVIEDMVPTTSGDSFKNSRLPIHVIGTKLYVGGALRNLTTNNGIWFVRECDLTACAVGNWVDSDNFAFVNKTPDYDISDFLMDQTDTLWSNGLSFDASSSIYFIARKRAASATSWTDALPEFGTGHFTTYFKTSANRFFAVGLDLNNGVKGIILEYR